ncbi:MAG: CpsD/CapB family tyrosine-protein kinase [Oscillospiraceae bacterium]|nr:CpsD/CapB family tyrosine-protein kinase [Oscillospiraceae bacterium]
MSKDKKRSTKNIEEFKCAFEDDSPFILKEAFKALRTNVTFSLVGSSSKCIGVASAERSDGKSTVLLNLAISYAQLGKKVILLDCDLRRPSIAKNLKIKSVPGLSDVIVGEETMENAIQTIKQYKLDVLPSGSIPPDATRLLESKQMEVMFQILKKYYDYVFVDLPPTTVVADSSIISKNLDGYIVVVRHGKSEYRRINDVINQLKMVDAKILGFVYNDAPVATKKGYGYYKYGYGYGYYK